MKLRNPNLFVTYGATDISPPLEPRQRKEWIFRHD